MNAPTAANPVPRGSVRFLIVTAGVMALSLLLAIIASAWPLPPACTASETPNPAWHSAVQIPATLATIGAIGSMLGGMCCFIGVLVAEGRRLAFLGLGVLAVGLILFATVLAFGIGVPCHAFY